MNLSEIRALEVLNYSFEYHRFDDFSIQINIRQTTSSEFAKKDLNRRINQKNYNQNIATKKMSLFKKIVSEEDSEEKPLTKGPVNKMGGDDSEEDEVIDFSARKNEEKKYMEEEEKNKMKKKNNDYHTNNMKNNKDNTSKNFKKSNTPIERLDNDPRLDSTTPLNDLFKKGYWRWQSYNYTSEGFCVNVLNSNPTMKNIRDKLEELWTEGYIKMFLGKNWPNLNTESQDNILVSSASYFDYVYSNPDLSWMLFFIDIDKEEMSNENQVRRSKIRDIFFRSARFFAFCLSVWRNGKIKSKDNEEEILSIVQEGGKETYRKTCIDSVLDRVANMMFLTTKVHTARIQFGNVRTNSYTKDTVFNTLFKGCEVTQDALWKAYETVYNQYKLKTLDNLMAGAVPRLKGKYDINKSPEEVSRMVQDKDIFGNYEKFKSGIEKELKDHDVKVPSDAISDWFSCYAYYNDITEQPPKNRNDSDNRKINPIMKDMTWQETEKSIKKINVKGIPAAEKMDLMANWRGNHGGSEFYLTQIDITSLLLLDLQIAMTLLFNQSYNFGHDQVVFTASSESIIHTDLFLQIIAQNYEIRDTTPEDFYNESDNKDAYVNHGPKLHSAQAIRSNTCFAGTYTKFNNWITPWFCDSPISSQNPPHSKNKSYKIQRINLLTEKIFSFVNNNWARQETTNISAINQRYTPVCALSSVSVSNCVRLFNCRDIFSYTEWEKRGYYTLGTKNIETRPAFQIQIERENTSPFTFGQHPLMASRFVSIIWNFINPSLYIEPKVEAEANNWDYKKIGLFNEKYRNAVDRLYKTKSTLDVAYMAASVNSSEFRKKFIECIRDYANDKNQNSYEVSAVKEVIAVIPKTLSKGKFDPNLAYFYNLFKWYDKFSEVYSRKEYNFILDQILDPNLSFGKKKDNWVIKTGDKDNNDNGEDDDDDNNIDKRFFDPLAEVRIKEPLENVIRKIGPLWNGFNTSSLTAFFLIGIYNNKLKRLIDNAQENSTYLTIPTGNINNKSKVSLERVVQAENYWVVLHHPDTNSHNELAPTMIAMNQLISRKNDHLNQAQKLHETIRGMYTLVHYMAARTGIKGIQLQTFYNEMRDEEDDEDNMGDHPSKRVKKI